MTDHSPEARAAYPDAAAAPALRTAFDAGRAVTFAATREALLDLLNSSQHAPMSAHDPRSGECVDCPWPLYALPPEEIADAILASGALVDADKLAARHAADVLLWLHNHAVNAEQLDMAVEHFVEPHGLSIDWAAAAIREGH